MKAVTISKNGGPEVLEIKDIKLEMREVERIKNQKGKNGKLLRQC